ncbi:DUF2802 domain-containing protein [Nitrococcus mobilis]|uniref:DUF2802 domain-containing protein n=1 Tax=Nitrococcus mobilis Nb-231 TaxID=314278 RepID=A4BUF8_9GAMM|nr:DUF2802 domain-containing protein [Nitrococcus mobilis]EAR20672.1 hypothetical protein NB231_02108 [Nitrococcus mobilis Nb-231]
MPEVLSWYALAVIIALAIASLLVAARALSRFSRLAARLRDLEQAQAQLAEHFQGLTAGAIGQGRQLAQLEQQLGRLRERLDQLASNDSGGTAFNTAIRLARKGISAREIMETCGLSKMEADLVILLHYEREES